MTIEKRIHDFKKRIELIEQGLNALDSALQEYGDNLLALSNLIPKAKPARESKLATEQVDELKKLSMRLIALGFSQYTGYGDEAILRTIAADFQGERVFINLDSIFDGLQCGTDVWVSAVELVFNTPDGYMIYIHRHDTDESFTEFVGMIANGFVPDWLSSFELIRAEGRFTIVVGRSLS